MKLTAPTAIPIPKTIPASIRLESPSPKANMSPPTTIATKLKPLAIGPMKAVRKTSTAFSQGEAASAAIGAEATITKKTTILASAEQARRPALEVLWFTRDLPFGIHW
jgi:hypothetical protein